ncbi:MFS transporter [Marinivivus vitaminiproducens]|uniref:MFS transporter n=1 Tax=Marinivivus vitaminiproducens TaxID=3035935 RepID=UPI00279F8DA1|nr:MFS transporter [Geminicoccaceae bacterium SCSIO 64248]
MTMPPENKYSMRILVNRTDNQGINFDNRSSTVGVVCRIFLPLAFAYLLSYFYRVVNAAIADDLVRDYDLTASSLGLLTAAYLLAFAVMQVPLGLLIDRFGVRRVQACNLVIAAAGAFLFARAGGLEALIVARAMIGAGVAVCLMAGFTMLTLALPPRQVPAAMGLLMAFGGLGAILAGAPVEAAVEAVGWRILFDILAALTLFAALAILVVLPEHRAARRESWRDLIAGLARIYRSRLFWRMAPLAVLTIGTGFALQGLWAGPWLADVGGLDPYAVGWHLSAMAAGLLLGSTACGPIVALGDRLGLAQKTVVGGLAVLFLIVVAVLAAGAADYALALWVVFGFLMNPLALSYNVLSQTFDSTMAGRVYTGINVLVIAGSFVIQVAVGWILDVVGRTEGQHYDPLGYAIGFGLIVGFGAIATVWYWSD